MQPGLRRLAPGVNQLTPNRIGDAALQAKVAVLSTSMHQALLSAPGFEAEAAVLALTEHATREHPDAFASDDSGDAIAHHLGWALRAGTPHGDGPSEIGRCLQALPAEWRLAALLCLAFAEDFAVIDGANGHIPWLAVCLPSHWAPEDKVGRHFAAVHAPVADNQMLITASDHLARLVTGSERWERFVWTVTPHGKLDNHPLRWPSAGWPHGVDADTLAARAFFRTERQTFIPLADRHQAIFTIHVEVMPLRDAVRDASRANRLHDALASMSPAVLRYRGLTDARDRLLGWLVAHAGA